jgi:hypothetical protein
VPGSCSPLCALNSLRAGHPTHHRARGSFFVATATGLFAGAGCTVLLALRGELAGL